MTGRHGHGPIEMRLVDSADRIEQVGDFMWGGAPGREVLVVAIPDRESGRGWSLSRWTINHRNHCDAQWWWDGDRERPTLSPSLHAVGIWHGWVRAGRLVEA